MPELRDAAERLVRHYPQTSLNPDALLALDVLAVRDALKREPEREAAVERLCRAAECLVARYPQTSLNPDALLGLDVLEVRKAVAAVRGREEEKGG